MVHLPTGERRVFGCGSWIERKNHFFRWLKVVEEEEAAGGASPVGKARQRFGVGDEAGPTMELGVERLGRGSPAQQKQQQQQHKAGDFGGSPGRASPRQGAPARAGARPSSGRQVLFIDEGTGTVSPRIGAGW